MTRSPRNMIIVLSHKFNLNQLRSQHAVRPLSIQGKLPVLSVLSKLPVHEESLASCTHSLKFFRKMRDLTQLEFPAACSSSSFLNSCRICLSTLRCQEEIEEVKRQAGGGEEEDKVVTEPSSSHHNYLCVAFVLARAGS